MSIIIQISLEEFRAMLHEALSSAAANFIVKGPSTEKQAEEYLNVVQAAHLLHKKKSTIYSLVHKRELPSYKRGGRLLFKKQELLLWIETGKRRTNDEIGNLLEQRTNKCK